MREWIALPIQLFYAWSRFIFAWREHQDLQLFKNTTVAKMLIIARVQEIRLATPIPSGGVVKRGMEKGDEGGTRRDSQ